MRLKDYELLFDLPVGEYSGAGVEGTRTQTFRAGRQLEVKVFPIVRLTHEARREAKNRRSRPCVAVINALNRERYHARILEANFSRRAIVVTLPYAYPVEDYAMCSLSEMLDIYERDGLPFDVEDVQRDKRNFVARLKRRMAAAGIDPAGLKWDMTIEEGKEPPAAGLPAKYHIHAVIEGEGVTPGMIESCWGHGRTHAERFDLDDDGPMRLARYLNKQRHPGRWWSHSRNLKIPEPTVSDRKVSRRRLSLLAADIMKNGREIMERLYPGYKIVEEPVVRYSDFVAGAYIYVRMRRRD